jgi:hypothetical protein
VLDSAQFRFVDCAYRFSAKAFALATIGRPHPGSRAVRLSKIVDYLIDNLCLCMLSRVEA